MLLLLLIFAFATPASAAIPNATVGDERVITNGTDAQRALALEQARAVGFDRVRLILDGYNDMDRVEHAAKQVRAAGFAITLTVNAPVWHRDSYATDPEDYAVYAGWAADRLASLVDTYTVFNEPDIALEGVGRTVCGRQLQHVTKRVRYKRRVRYRRVKAGRRLELYRRVVLKRGRKGWRKRVRGPAMVRAGRYRVRSRTHRRRWVKVKVYRPRLYKQTVKGCHRWTSADVYRDIYRAGYAALKTADPSARVLIGDTAPGWGHFGWQQRLFGMVPGYGNTAKLVADGYAHHPYENNRDPTLPPSTVSSGLSRCVQHRDLLAEAARTGHISRPDGSPLKLAYTEFGYLNVRRPSWATLTDSQIARYLPQAWALAERCGVTDMAQYHLWDAGSESPWNSPLADVDGQPLPMYKALQHYLGR